MPRFRFACSFNLADFSDRLLALGRGGLKAMNELTGMSRPTILKGIRELQQHKELASERIRQPGGDASDWKNPIKDWKQRWSRSWKRTRLGTR
jgi:hypothetical protein